MAWTTPSTWFSTSPVTPDDQAARNLAISDALYQRLAQYGNQYNTAQNGQQALINQLYGVVNGTAPSVAQGQLQQGLGQIAANQQSAASGVGGVNAALARTQAMQNTAQAQAQANQAASLVRANESAEARGQIGNVLGQQAGEANTATGIATGGSNQAAGNAAENQKESDQLAGHDLDFWTNAIKGVGQGVATLYSGGNAQPKAG